MSHHIVVALLLLVVVAVLRRGWCQDHGEAVVTEQLQDAGREHVSTHTHTHTPHTHTHTTYAHTQRWPLTSDP